MFSRTAHCICLTCVSDVPRCTVLQTVVAGEQTGMGSGRRAERHRGVRYVKLVGGRGHASYREDGERGAPGGPQFLTDKQTEAPQQSASRRATAAGHRPPANQRRLTINCRHSSADCRRLNASCNAKCQAVLSETSQRRYISSLKARPCELKVTTYVHFDPLQGPPRRTSKHFEVLRGASRWFVVLQRAKI